MLWDNKGQLTVQSGTTMTTIRREDYACKHCGDMDRYAKPCVSKPIMHAT